MSNRRGCFGTHGRGSKNTSSSMLLKYCGVTTSFEAKKLHKTSVEEGKEGGRGVMPFKSIRNIKIWPNCGTVYIHSNSQNYIKTRNRQQMTTTNRLLIVRSKTDAL